MPKQCKWSEDADGNWETECGDMFVLIVDTPSKNGMKYCCYCGCVLVEEFYEEPTDET